MNVTWTWSHGPVMNVTPCGVISFDFVNADSRLRWTLETIGPTLLLHGNYAARLVWYTMVVCVHQSRVEGLHCLLDQWCRDSTHMSLGDCLVNFFSVLVFSNRNYIARLMQIKVAVHRCTMILIWGWLLRLDSPGIEVYILNMHWCTTYIVMWPI